MRIIKTNLLAACVIYAMPSLALAETEKVSVCRAKPPINIQPGSGWGMGNTLRFVLTKSSVSRIGTAGTFLCTYYVERAPGEKGGRVMSEGFTLDKPVDLKYQECRNLDPAQYADQVQKNFDFECTLVQTRSKRAR